MVQMTVYSIWNSMLSHLETVVYTFVLSWHPNDIGQIIIRAETLQTIDFKSRVPLLL